MSQVQQHSTWLEQQITYLSVVSADPDELISVVREEAEKSQARLRDLVGPVVFGEEGIGRGSLLEKGMGGVGVFLGTSSLVFCGMDVCVSLGGGMYVSFSLPPPPPPLMIPSREGASGFSSCFTVGEANNPTKGQQ